MVDELERDRRHAAPHRTNNTAQGAAEPHDSRERGFVLLFVLWILAGIALSLAFFSETASAPRSVLARLQEPLESRQRYSALDHILWRIMDRTLTVDARWITQREILVSDDGAVGDPAVEPALRTLREILSQLEFDLALPEVEPESLAKRTRTREIARREQVATESYQMHAEFAPRRVAYSVPIVGETYSVTVQPRGALPNLNLIPLDVLQRYLVFLGLDEIRAAELAAVIVDWRDDNTVSMTGGADDLYYLGLRSGYRPHNSAITHWGELAFVKNATADLVELLRNNFVLHGKDWRVDPDYVEPRLIAALADLDEQVVRRAIDHALSPRPGERGLSLADVIGQQQAEQFNNAVLWNSTTDPIVIVSVSEGRSQVKAVFDRDRNQLLDLAEVGG